MRLPTKENAIAETKTLVSDVIYQVTVSLKSVNTRTYIGITEHDFN